MKNNRSLLCILVCLVMLAALPMHISADADEPDCSLTLQYTVNSNMPMVGSPFSVYRVADLINGAAFRVTDAFVGSGIELSGIEDNESWLNKAAFLANYASANSISPSSTSETDALGTVVFEPLERGLYLIVGETEEVDRAYYTPTPFFICLPNMQRGEWVNDVFCNVKYTKEGPEPIELTDHKVLKVWDDNDASAKRPAFIIVNLTMNGIFYDSVKLTSEDNWRYTWSDLPVCDESGAPISWSVLENSVKGYTVSVEEQGITTVITNKSDADSPDTPDPPLPQTGQEWTSVLILAGAGTLFVLFGLLLKKGREE